MGDGERQGFREGMNRMTKQLVDAGNSPRVAREKAQKAAIRADNKFNGRPNERRKPRE